VGRSPTSAGSLLRPFLETTPDIVLFKDADSRYLAVSRSFYRERHGLMSESEAIGKSDLDFYSTEFGEETHAAEREIIATGEPKVDVERLLLRSDRPGAAFGRARALATVRALRSRFSSSSLPTWSSRSS